YPQIAPGLPREKLKERSPQRSRETEDKVWIGYNWRGGFEIVQAVSSTENNPLSRFCHSPMIKRHPILEEPFEMKSKEHSPSENEVRNCTRIRLYLRHTSAIIFSSATSIHHVCP